MAVLSPPFALGSPSVVHPARLDRLTLGGLFLPGAGVTVRTGVLHGPAGQVGASALSGTNVAVDPARWIIQSTHSAVGGSYVLTNDAGVMVPVPARDPANPRRALVAVWAADAEAANLPSNPTNDGGFLAAIPGDPAAVPALPTEPANSIVLGELTIPSSANGGAITYIPRAVPVTALRGQPLPVANAAARTALGNLFSGLDVIQLDTGRRWYWDGDEWQAVPLDVPPTVYVRPFANQADRVAASGAFDGQLAVETDTDRLLRWTGTAWRYVGDHLVVANAAARDALSPRYDGLTVRLADTGAVYYVDGSSWVAPTSTGPAGVIARTSTTATSGDGAMIPGPLGVTLAAGRLYRVRAVVRGAGMGGTSGTGRAVGRFYGVRASTVPTTGHTMLGPETGGIIENNGSGVYQNSWQGEEYVAVASTGAHSFGLTMEVVSTPSGTFANPQVIVEDVGTVAGLAAGANAYTTIPA